MVAARQLLFLEASTDSVAAELDKRLSRMTYGDAMICNGWRLEKIAMWDSYVEWLLYDCGHLYAVVEVRGVDKRGIRRRLAGVLAHLGWQIALAGRVDGGARTDPEAKLPRCQRFFKQRRVIRKGK